MMMKPKKNHRSIFSASPSSIFSDDYSSGGELQNSPISSSPSNQEMMDVDFGVIDFNSAPTPAAFYPDNQLEQQHSPNFIGRLPTHLCLWAQ